MQGKQCSGLFSESFLFGMCRSKSATNKSVREQAGGSQFRVDWNLLLVLVSKGVVKKYFLYKEGPP